MVSWSKSGGWWALAFFDSAPLFGRAACMTARRLCACSCCRRRTAMPAFCLDTIAPRDAIRAARGGLAGGYLLPANVPCASPSTRCGLPYTQGRTKSSIVRLKRARGQQARAKTRGASCAPVVAPFGQRMAMEVWGCEHSGRVTCGLPEASRTQRSCAHTSLLTAPCAAPHWTAPPHSRLESFCVGALSALRSAFIDWAFDAPSDGATRAPRPAPLLQWGDVEGSDGDGAAGDCPNGGSHVASLTVGHPCAFPQLRTLTLARVATSVVAISSACAPSSPENPSVSVGMPDHPARELLGPLAALAAGRARAGETGCVAPVTPRELAVSAEAVAALRHCGWCWAPRLVELHLDGSATDVLAIDASASTLLVDVALASLHLTPVCLVAASFRAQLCFGARRARRSACAHPQRGFSFPRATIGPCAGTRAYPYLRPTRASPYTACCRA